MSILCCLCCGIAESVSSASTAAYMHVSRPCLPTCATLLQVVSIQRNQQPLLLNRFEERVASKVKKYYGVGAHLGFGQPTVDHLVKPMWHGCGNRNRKVAPTIDILAESGLDPKYSKGGKQGRGLYVAERPAFSISGFSSRAEEQTFSMLTVRQVMLVLAISGTTLLPQCTHIYQVYCRECKIYVGGLTTKSKVKVLVVFSAWSASSAQTC